MHLQFWLWTRLCDHQHSFFLDAINHFMMRKYHDLLFIFFRIYVCMIIVCESMLVSSSLIWDHCFICLSYAWIALWIKLIKLIFGYFIFNFFLEIVYSSWSSLSFYLLYTWWVRWASHKNLWFSFQQLKILPWSNKNSKDFHERHPGQILV